MIKNSGKVLAFTLSMSLLLGSFSAQAENAIVAQAVDLATAEAAAAAGKAAADAVKEVPISLTTKVLAASIATLVGLAVYRLESKGRCEDVSYDFDLLMRGTESYKDTLKRMAAWVDRYVIGQPYKSSSVKADASGNLIVSQAQEAKGFMGIAQSNIKPISIGFGSFMTVYALLALRKIDLTKKLDSLPWDTFNKWFEARVTKVLDVAKALAFAEAAAKAGTTAS